MYKKKTFPNFLYYRDKDKHYRRGHSSESYLDDINSNDSFDRWTNQTKQKQIIEKLCDSNFFSSLFIKKHLNFFFSDHVNNSEYYRNQIPTNVIVILGIAKHLTEGDVSFG